MILNAQDRKNIPKSQMGLPYLAGLFDGEGCIQIIRQTSHILIIKITMTNKEVLQTVKNTFGGSLFGPYKHKGLIHHKPTWEWRMTGKNAYELLGDLFPYLIVKRIEAEVGIDFGNYMYIWNKQKPRNQYNPVTAQEMDNREVWRLALMGLKRGL